MPSHGRSSAVVAGLTCVIIFISFISLVHIFLPVIVELLLFHRLLKNTVTIPSFILFTSSESYVELFMKGINRQDWGVRFVDRRLTSR
jgi:hypothetical protein